MPIHCEKSKLLTLMHRLIVMENLNKKEVLILLNMLFLSHSVMVRYTISYFTCIHTQIVYLYNSSHKLSSHIQRIVLHHVEGHRAHYQHMLLVMQVHTAAAYKERRHTRVSGTKKLR